MAESLHISGASGGDATNMSLIGASAIAHGKELLELGYSVDQVVHDYGDICQAITDLAVERDAPFSVNEFRTLNRCLDNAIANAVSEFSARRDVTFALKQSADENERRGVLVHEIRNHVSHSDDGIPRTGVWKACDWRLHRGRVEKELGFAVQTAERFGG